MTMTSQDIVAEQARRIIGRIAAAAGEIGVKSDVRLNVTVLHQHKVVARATSSTTGAAIKFVKIQTDGAVQRDRVVEFEISPLFPTFTITHTGDVEVA